MREILDKGKIKMLISDSGSAGWSGEAHLVEHNGNKYVLRRCKKLENAKRYQEVSSRFEKYDFLPKFLGRFEKDIIYEYIEGRDLKKKEEAGLIGQVGKIAAKINEFPVNGSPSTRFNKMIRECVSGYYEMSKESRSPILTSEKANRMKKLFNYMKRRTNPSMAWDTNDMYNENYRVRNEKVYFVDIEAIKPRIKGFGIGKAFTKWFKSEKDRNSFERGYRSVAGKFFSEEYLDLILLLYLTQEVNYKGFFGAHYKPRHKTRLSQLNDLLNKYGV